MALLTRVTVQALARCLRRQRSGEGAVASASEVLDETTGPASALAFTGWVEAIAACASEVMMFGGEYR